MLKKILLLSSALAFMSAATLAHADTIFVLNQDGCSGTCGVAPFGTVDLSQTNSTTVTVTVTLNQANGTERFAGTGAGDALEFNLSSNPAITIGNITTGFGVGPSPDTASTFGSFDYSVTCTACQGGKSSNPAGPLSFTVTSASGVTIADFTANTGGYYFASDIFGNNGKTGNVAANSFSNTPSVPEPSSLLLFGTGVLSAAGLLRRRFF
ncbi:hypothetical protein GCM10011507_17040 [Edaphobacter acidisoli]|uniref:Ice-binding protein C-terminal domain-containing protein n=1 Tax=Edaphobacter acidisoli TaxID=2040573 RepID=A0A916RR01_9BACT|nr:PEP-CTERM sorting domain-containing protein [Edaphobacter acidisoli]GGA66022.1 hypothetical protein GCM10011507_17040 [Edaphobacter acidisoli]